MQWNYSVLTHSGSNTIAPGGCPWCKNAASQLEYCLQTDGRHPWNCSACSPSKAMEPSPNPKCHIHQQTKLEPMSFSNSQQLPLVYIFFFYFNFLSTSQLHSEMFFLKTCLLLRYKSTYFSRVVHGGVMQYKKITSWWWDVNNSNTKH